VVPLKILHQILYFIEPSSEPFSLKNASTFVHTDLCSSLLYFPPLSRYFSYADHTILLSRPPNFVNCSRVVTSIFDLRFDTATVVVKRNSTRQAINRARLWHFAESRAQRIYLFAAQDSRTVSTSNSCLTLEDLLSQQDDGTKCPCPGMPVMILANVCTLMGQVNGTMGIATKAIFDETGCSLLHLSNLVIASTIF